MTDKQRFEKLFKEFPAEKTPADWNEKILNGLPLNSDTAGHPSQRWPSWLPALVTAATALFVLWGIFAPFSNSNDPADHEENSKPSKHAGARKDSGIGTTEIRKAIEELAASDASVRLAARALILKHPKEANPLVEEAWKQSWHLVSSEAASRDYNKYVPGTVITSFEDLGNVFSTVSNPTIDWTTHNLLVVSVGDCGHLSNGVEKVEIGEENITVHVWEKRVPHMSFQATNVNCLGVAVPKSKIPVKLSKTEVQKLDNAPVSMICSPGFPELQLIREKIKLTELKIEGGEEKEGLKIYLYAEKDDWKIGESFGELKQDETGLSAWKPNIKVRLEYSGQQKIWLPGNLLRGTMQPQICEFVIVDPDGKKIDYLPLNGPKTKDILQSSHFVVLQEGALFDPFGPVSGYSCGNTFGHDDLNRSLTFQKTGTYKIHFRYSTEGIQTAVRDDSQDKGLEEIMKNVPSITLESNEIQIEVK